jgi:thiol:disulfide interchange protein DsbC
MHIRINQLILFGLLFTATLNVSAALFDDDSTKEEVIRSQLKLSLPELKVDQVIPTAINNVYEVDAGHKVFYVDKSGRYALFGNLVDLSNKQNITQKRVEQLGRVDWNKLPLNIAIRHVIGNGSRRIAVFTDPDCPFCKKLEQETIAKLKNVTVYYFLFPLPTHQYAEIDSQKIICSENTEDAYLGWMVEGRALPKKSTCANDSILTKMQQVGNDVVQVEVTPTIILPDGSIVTGLAPADYLSQLIDNTSPPPPSVSSAATTSH